MKSSGACLAFTLCLSSLVAGVASAQSEDYLSGTRGLVKEAGHTVAITLHHGHAILVVRRTLWNWGIRHDQGTYHLVMPEWTVATGLRTRGMANGRPVWFKGDLLEAEAAATKYKELTGIGGYYPKDPALLSWRSEDQLALQVFPLAPGEGKMIEYTLTMSTRYENDRDILQLPRMGLPCHNPELSIRSALATDRVWVNGQPFPQNGTMPWPKKNTVEDGAEKHDEKSTDARDGPGHRAPPIKEPLCAEQGADQVTIELHRAHVPTLGGRLAVQPFAKDKVLVRYQIETPAEFAKVPVRPSVVVLLDDSRSMNERDQWAGAAAIHQVLSRMPDARVAILAFSRHVRPITKGFVPATTAIANLAAYAYVRDNGSAVDEALKSADALLAKSPTGSPRRVYLLSDLATRTALNPLKLRTAFKRSQAVVHIATLTNGASQLHPDDETPWSKVARATTGLSWTGSASAQSTQRDALANVFEEWVRPTRLFKWKMAKPALDFEDAIGTDNTLSDAAELPTGIAFASMGISGWKIDDVKLRGELWSRPVSATVKPDGVEAQIWSGLAFRSSLTTALSVDEQMVLAKRGRAVSPVTSYLAIEPGVRPSTEGLEETGGQSGAGSGSGSGYGSGTSNYGSSRRPYDYQKALVELLSKAWATCGGAGQPASLTLENTETEVVDISNAKAPTQTLGHCLQEAAWKFELPDEFSAIAQKSWELSVN